MRISFDYDGTLTLKNIQRIAKAFIDAGHEVWCTTQRGNFGVNAYERNAEVFKLCQDLGIGHNIQFTNYEDKRNFLDTFDLHFDNDEEQVDSINLYSRYCVAFHYKHLTTRKRL